MKLVTTTDNLEKRFGMEKAIDMLCAAGYDGIDFSAFTPKFYTDEIQGADYYVNIRKYAEDKGLTFEQAHAPFSSGYYVNPETGNNRFDEITCAMRNAAILGSKIIVVHPIQDIRHHVGDNAEKLFETNMEFYKKLIPFAEEYGIKVALENMWQTIGVARRGIGQEKICHSVCSRPEEFVRYLEELNNDCFCACLDLGHVMLMRENQDDFIRKLGNKYLKCLHVHDCDGDVDDHTLPYYGITDWDRVTKALHDINFDGNLTFEADNFIANIPNELCQPCANYMASVGKYLISKIK